MNGDRQLERALPEILADLGAAPNPDYTRSLLARTARARQRPAWVFPGRWINVDVALRPSAAAPSAKRFVALATLLLIAALVAAGLYVGSRPRVPAPFGPARNGAMVFARPTGEIVVHDPFDSPPRLLIDAVNGGQWPSYSPDGTRLVYVREHSTGFDLVTARADGTEVTTITPAPLSEGPWWWAWTPDSRSVAVVTSNRADAELRIYDAAGPREPSVVETGLQVDAPAFRPAHHDQMVFRGAAGPMVGLYLMNLDGSGLRTLIEPFREDDPTDIESDLRNPAWSPDGSQVAYQQFDPTVDAQVIFVMDVETRETRRLGFYPGDVVNNNPVWSPDGTRIAFQKDDGVGWRNAVVDVATGKDTVLDPPMIDGGNANIWLPDGTKILAIPWLGATAQLLDPDGGPPIDLFFGAGGAGSTGVGAGAGAGIQRLAP